MKTTENDIPATAGERYRQTWEGYLKALRSSPWLTLSSYCKEHHIHCKGLRQWMRCRGLSVRPYKRYYRPPVKRQSSEAVLAPQPRFVQIIPDKAVVGSSLHGVKLAFPDGVTLTLQESTPEGIVALVETYERRRSAREAGCSR